MTRFTHALQLPTNGEQVSPELSAWLRNNPNRWRESFNKAGFQFLSKGLWITAEQGDWLCFNREGRLELQPADRLNMQG